MSCMSSSGSDRCVWGEGREGGREEGREGGREGVSARAALAGRYVCEFVSVRVDFVFCVPGWDGGKRRLG